MSLAVLGVWMLLGGAVLAFIIYNAVENEYPLVYWLAWGVAVGGLLACVAALQPVRTNYLIWSSALGVILMGLFFAGRSEGEWLPGAWCGVGILLVNLILGLGSALPVSVLPLVYGTIAVGLVGVGYARRRRGRALYDAAYSGAAIAVVMAGLIATQSIRTPLEQLNITALPKLNNAYTNAQMRIQSFPERLTQAQQIRQQIDQQFADDDAAALDVVDRYVQGASERHRQAQALLQQIGKPPVSLTRYHTGVETEITANTERAAAAMTEAQAALDQLSSVQQVFEELSEEWIKEYLWFEVDGYWTSEESESPAYNVCYYGERFSTRTNNGAQEQLVSDEMDRTGNQSIFGSDRGGLDWKHFTVDDYNELVNSAIVPAADSAIESDEQAGYYLCGRSPQTGQYGALGEPTVVIEKEYGSLRREIGDEGSSFVGNERYGTWCVQDTNGNVTPIPADQSPPPDAQWCWYQKPGDSTNYYWERQTQGNTFIWFRSHRRCVYCTPQARWGGGELVSDREMARANGTDGSTVRGPRDQGGGPGTGK